MTLFNEMILDSNSLFLKKGFGWVIFYPKGDKLLLCKQNRWLYGGFSWIRKHILKNNGNMQNRCADHYSAP